MKLTWPAFIEAGKLEIVDREAFKETLKMMSGDVLITIEHRKSRRSNQQNRYYWSIVVGSVKDGLMEKGHDYTPDEVHEGLKWRFLQKHEEGIEFPTVRSTATLTTTEFMDYIAEIQRWAAEYLQTVIPDPQEHL